jgi:hypothetical protein
VEGLAINANGASRRSKFFTKIARLFLGYGRALSDEERADFWHQIAFYNYVQWWLDDRGVRPTPEMWRTAQAPFLEVLQELRPKLVLVLGRELASELPSIPEHIVTLPIPHPSSYGWTYEPWTTQVTQALNTTD